MSDTLHKFLFLGAMIAIVVFANRGTVAEQRQNFTYGKNETVAVNATKPPPVFVLQPPQKTLADNIAVLPIDQVAEVADAGILRNAIAQTIDRQIGTASMVTNNNLDPFTQVSGAFLESSANPSKGAFSRVANAEAPAIQARIALVADILSGESYFSLESTKRWPLASITKLISAVIAIQSGNQNTSTILTASDFLIESSDKNLKIGDRYSIGDLILAALLKSSNESAEAIASFFGRGEFIARMNTQVVSWGFTDTYFDDPTGLSASNQSTAIDLLGLSRQIYEKYPEIFKITQKPSVYITELGFNKRLLIENINLFAGQDNFLGGKTGFIDESGGNLLSVFSYRSRPIIIIVLNTNDRFGDTEKLLNWFMANYK